MPLLSGFFLIISGPVVAVAIQIRAAGQEVGVDNVGTRSNRWGLGKLFRCKTGRASGLALQLTSGLVTQGLVQLQHELQARPGNQQHQQAGNEELALKGQNSGLMGVPAVTHAVGGVNAIEGVVDLQELSAYTFDV